MAVANSSIAALFDKLADILDIEGANEFRIRAYRNAARMIAAHPGSVAGVIQKGETLHIPGIGKDLAGKVAEIVNTGKLTVLEDALKRTPPGLTALLEIPGLGPKRVRLINHEFDIATLDGLERVIRTGELRKLRGFGPKLEGRILAALDQRKEATKKGEGQRTSIWTVRETADILIAYLKAQPGVLEVEAAGSYRRRQETIGDLDILVTCRKGSSAATSVMERFVGNEDVDKSLAQGPTRSTVILKNGLQVDLRVVPQSSYGAALVYFTGSKAHNIAIRAIGQKLGVKVNEYGVFRGTEQIAGRTEEEVYRALKLEWIPPELRENRGEVEAASKGELPDLVRVEQIRGDLHAHTQETDGRRTLEEMVEAARQRGYEYLAITDHTRHLTVAKGMDPRRIGNQIRKIDQLNSKLKGFRILKSAEVDILEDGSLDLPDSILKELDLRVCSIHFRFNLPQKKQTERVIRAMDNPYFNILAHPSGRLIGKRPAYEIDLDRILIAAHERGCFVEVNSQPDRLDLTDHACRKAKELGVKIVISTDAHNDSELAFMPFGIGQARRGWLSAQDVLNTRPWPEIERLVRSRLVRARL